MLRVFFPVLLPIFSFLLGGVPSPEVKPNYLALNNSVSVQLLSMQDQGDDAATDYSIDTAQTQCSDDETDLEEFNATRLTFTIENSHYLPVQVTKVRVRIRNIVTGERVKLRLSPYAYSEIGAGDTVDVKVLLGSISGGLKYFTGTSTPLEEGQYNITARITIKSSSGESTIIRKGISLGAADLNRC